MKLKLFNLGLMTTVLLGVGLASDPASAANGIPGRVISQPGKPADPQFGNWRGSYYKDQTVWGDGIEHIGEVGTTLRSVYYVYGTAYQDCHSALIAEMNAAYATGWTDCSQL
ncbi:hypothetical protein [Lysobacter sp. Root983]|uniref:hypothetical protein n=1 Tax=Lysobacter sp. Root983 TaxID=1736613 RepID=UPI00070C0292|nr:hypothetical protein [Lysobacter sp. Root983]KRD77535.1 hypothetical protein ASE43_10435 [Lysobacter sp. Root983]